MPLPQIEATSAAASRQKRNPQSHWRCSKAANESIPMN
ncbi:hypothetical protein YPPY54_2456 [Yersinia pestis PY-54]|uniref:Uncharacterized protein n=1 Tax=Yersinia pestis biovar Orientalis str. IP275 TaxID=373665 RepID=A0AAV3B562_YERPE|nr:hypothetical protein YPIP275_0655 [Yersinia pestis biovar Orientalis str. IP275]EDR44210.1 hypothetical protein YpE1979001_0414 [Yersinia pestis biovar Antiqua str. E1979001]EDR57926.1 hypothetical protein YpMG051020_3389 [Yersinia pestis biovar Orientalis str. MG05-1020]EDR66367.1 hypothetical protein YpK1973002_3905 [Yersinia pestis biovar Mediaevalis str. K1973002]EIS25602.1 hypothetical protein YPPY54_2456 [Yersinia pestis PY-54]EIT30429.1 hypothetical protein YPPY96_2324 [Yersinia pest